MTPEPAPQHPLAAAVAPRCAHCHQPIHTVALDPRWAGYCDVCARRLAGRQRHPESA